MTDAFGHRPLRRREDSAEVLDAKASTAAEMPEVVEALGMSCRGVGGVKE